VSLVREKIERESGRQVLDKTTQQPLWVVELIARDRAQQEGASLISVTVAGERPKIDVGHKVQPVRLRAIPWVSSFGGEARVRIAYRAESIAPVAVGKVAGPVSPRH
jgi:hypothetical protein